MHPTAMATRAAAHDLIPAPIARLPHYQGLPILYTSLVEQGRPDFRVTDATKSQHALRAGLCGICGTRLGNWKLLLLSQEQVTLRAYNSAEPLMHEACLRYALTLCPFLLRQKPRSTRALPADVYTGAQHLDRAGALFLGWTRTYHTKMVHGVLYALADHLHRIEQCAPAEASHGR